MVKESVAPHSARLLRPSSALLATARTTRGTGKFLSPIGRSQFPPFHRLPLGIATRVAKCGKGLSAATTASAILNDRLLATGLAISLVQIHVQPSPSCYRVSQIFHPFSHMAPCPLQMGGGGGGHIQFSQKHNFWSIMCIF